MGFKSTSTRRSTAASAVSSQAVMVNTGNSVGGAGTFSAVGSTIAANTSISLGVTTVGQTSAATTTTVSAGPAITTIQYLDTSNAVISNGLAASTVGGNILITGTGFVANSNIYVNNSLVSNTFISSTQIRAILPSASAGNVSLMIFTPALVGTISTNGVRYSGVPTWTTAAVSFQNATAGNVALVVSSDSTLTYTLQAGSTLPTGISLVSAGYLSGTATGYSTNTSSTAVIVATDAEGQATQQTLNITITVSDPQFPYTTLLLNGETSVTPFIADASTNSSGLTIAGDTKANKFSPYYGNGYYSVQFNGTVNDYLSVPHNSGLSIMSGDTGTFVAECWVYWTTVNASCVIMDKSGRNGVSFQNWSVELDASKYFKLVWGASGTPGTSAIGVLTTSIIPVAGQWYHVAFVKSNADWSLFINGTRATTYNGLNTANDANPAALRVGLGIDGEYNGGYLSGYVSNVRVYNGPAGSAPYAATSTTITVPTAPLTTATSVSALTNQSARYLDNSTTNATITPGTGVKISPAIPFTANSSYSTYGSAYFDGTGDYLTRSNINFAANSFTIEGWFYPTTVANTTNFWGTDNGSGSTPKMLMYIDSSSRLTIDFGTAGTTQFPIAAALSSYGPYVNQWNHIALVRSDLTSTGLKLYINGVLAGTGQLGTNLNTITAPFNIGYIGEAYGNPFTGFISDFRVVNGTAIYTAAFTPPTTPLTAVANTQLLTLQYNGGANNYGIIDNGPFNNVITRAGNASQGSVSPYSQTGWSVYTSDRSYLSIPTSSTFDLISTDFTVEFWFKPVAFNTMGYSGNNLFGNGLSTATGGWAMSWDGSGSTVTSIVYQVYNGGWQSNTFTVSIPLGTWAHVALVRNGSGAGNLKLYVNGVLQGTAQNQQTYSVAGGTFTLGSGAYTQNASYSGNAALYLSNVRISKSVVYAEAFTAPASPLTTGTSPVLLMCQNNRYINNGSTSGNVTSATHSSTYASIQAFSPFSPSAAYTPSLHGGSAYFDGTGDYLTVGTFAPGSNNFTVEFWFYCTALPASGQQGMFFATPWGGSNFQTYISSDSTIIWQAYTQNNTNVAVKLNQWYHVAVVKNGSTAYFYINGVLQNTATLTNSISGTATVGAREGGLFFTGYISDMRVSIGTTVYTGAFTPPTAPLTSSIATPPTLLLNFTNGGIVDQHSSNNLETVGNAQLSTAVKKYGNASLSFTGSQSLLFPGSSIPGGAGSAFTVEFWINAPSYNALTILRANGNASSLGLSTNSSGQLIVSNTFAADFYTSTTALSPNVWTHVAIVRTSANLYTIYFNGTSAGTAVTYATSLGIATQMYIGYNTYNGAYSTFYLDDLRVTQGFARYTANFTPPSSAMLGQ